MASPRRARAVKFVLLLLCVGNVFDPGGAFGLRYLAFAGAVLCALWNLRYFSSSSRELTIGLTLFVVWPTWSLLYGVARGGDVYIAVVQVSPFVFTLLVALILSVLDDQAPLRMFYGCLFFLAVAVTMGFASIVLLPSSYFSQILLESLLGLNEREGYFRMLSLGGLEVPWIYFRSTLFLVPAFVYYLYVNRLLRAGVILLALGLTFSKAGLTIALVFGAVYSVRALLIPSTKSTPNKRSQLRLGFRRFLPIAVVAVIISVILLSLPTLLGDISDAWQGESDTAQVRIGHFQSVMELFLRHPSILIMGQGAGVPFYSLGENDYVQNFEIDHLNAIRKFGLLWFVGYSAIAFYSARGLIKSGQAEKRALGFALVSMYFAAGTNPVLISDLFIILLTLSYSAQRRSTSLSRVQKLVLDTGAPGPVAVGGSGGLVYDSGVEPSRPV